MDDIPLVALASALVALLLVSAFFSIAETAMMAANRYRLRHLAQLGQRGPQVALALLARTDRLLGVILLGNTAVNAVASVVTTIIAVRLFGGGEWAYAFGTALITFAILVFSEMTPKVVGAAYADRIAPAVAFVLSPLLRIAYPVIWFVNLFVQALLKTVRLAPGAVGEVRLSHEELRSLVLEGSHYLRGEHRSMLANLFDIEKARVDDLMTPRNQIEAIDLLAPVDELSAQLGTSRHTRLPVYEETLDNLVGVLHVRQVLHLREPEDFSRERLRAVLRPAYFIPSGTTLLTQLQNFRNTQQRMGLIVDEYGELLGMVTLEDIIEEIIGEFTTGVPGADTFRREPDGSVVVDGGTLLRTLNRKVGTRFPLTGPKTLSGLIVEHFGDIPESGVSTQLGNARIEVLHSQDRAVRVARVRVVSEPAAGAALQPHREQA